MRAAGYVYIATFVALLATFSTAQNATEAPFVNAVINAASYADHAISPGEMVVIFGTDLGPDDLASLTIGPDGRLVNELEGVRVLAGGVPCPLIYVSRNQLAAMIPYGVSAGKRTLIQVEVAGVKSNTFEVAVGLSVPGIFTADASGAGQAAINNADGTMNSSSSPAQRGSWITFYLTGEGGIFPAGDTGAIASGATSVVLPVKVKIAGYDAEVLYAGSAPGNVNGFAQVNAIVPLDLPFGGNLPLVVQVGASTSRPDVTVAVEGPQAPHPSSPLDLTLRSFDNGEIQATWKADGPPASKFFVERSVNGGGFQQIAAVDAGQTGYNDLPSGDVEELAYRVQAYNAWGISEYSGTTYLWRGPPDVKSPSKLQSSTESASEILLSWLNPDSSASEIVIESKSSITEDFVEIARISTASSFSVGQLDASTTYLFRVKAVGSEGTSGYSNTSISTTLASATENPPPLPLTYAVSGHVSGTTSTIVTLSGPSSASTMTDNSGNFSFTGLQNGVYVVVPSKPGFMFSPLSALVMVNSSSASEIDFTATAQPPSPPAITLSWYASASPNVVGYNVYRSVTNDGSFSKLNSSPIIGTIYIDSNVVPGPIYYYVATAVDQFGVESLFSNQATAQLNAPVP
jgi:uncharacterized protein (TIGR03437 family)